MVSISKRCQVMALTGDVDAQGRIGRGPPAQRFAGEFVAGINRIQYNQGNGINAMAGGLSQDLCLPIRDPVQNFWAKETSAATRDGRNGTDAMAGVWVRTPCPRQCQVFCKAETLSDRILGYLEEDLLVTALSPSLLKQAALLSAAQSLWAPIVSGRCCLLHRDGVDAGRH